MEKQDHELGGWLEFFQRGNFKKNHYLKVELQHINYKLNIMAVLKVIELMASSDKSWEEATQTAVKTASKTVKEIRSVYVQDMTGVVKGDKVVEFRVTVRVTFAVV